MIGRVGRILLAPVRRIAGGWRTTRRTTARPPEVVDAVLVLPALARQLEAIRFSTATLPAMHAELARVRGDTAGVRELTEVLVALRGAALRLGRLSERWPQRTVVAAPGQVAG